MLIALTPEQEARLQAYVGTGEFASIEEAARQLLDAGIAQSPVADEDDDLEWAVPLLEGARASIARGDLLTLEEHQARNATRRAMRRG